LNLFGILRGGSLLSNHKVCTGIPKTFQSERFGSVKRFLNLFNLNNRQNKKIKIRFVVSAAAVIIFLQKSRRVTPPR